MPEVFPCAKPQVAQGTGESGMSFRVGDMEVICEEPEMRCELCGKVEECRPYGPKGEQVCFECGMKDEAAAKRQMNKKLFGEGNA
jgi:hypothetical protein